MRLDKLLLSFVMGLILSACQTFTPQSYDYTAFKESRPKSILVLPPINESPEVKATAGMLTATIYPISEAGYYVLPVALVSETFKQNGLSHPADIHQVGIDKLREIFGSDAILYITVKEYGTKYQVIKSVTTVSANAILVDARTGKELWRGYAKASDDEQKNNNNGGLLSALINAVIDQVVGTLSDKGYDVALFTGVRLLSPMSTNGILYGPRSPHYQQELQQ